MRPVDTAIICPACGERAKSRLAAVEHAHAHLSETDLERHGKCEDCDSRGSLFQLPTGHLFCINCTSAYISWELDGGREADPEMYAWLWEASGTAVSSEAPPPASGSIGPK